ncbi:MAG: 2-oxoacid:acceptor oxidoreductase family protein [Spirochaetota bacterium]
MKTKMKPINIHLCGVGGQGIGLLSETILRAYDHAGIAVRAVDTHGLAQRGGIVRSNLRVGENGFSPLIEKGHANIVMALERTEALRGAMDYARPGGLVIYYDAYWQALPVRLGEHRDVEPQDIERYGQTKQLRIVRVFRDDLPDIRMQNMALLAEAMSQKLLPQLQITHVKAALDDLLPQKILKANQALFDFHS